MEAGDRAAVDILNRHIAEHGQDARFKQIGVKADAGGFQPCPLLLFDELRENLPQRRTVARQQQLSPEVCLQQGSLLLRFSALYGGRMHRVNVDRPLEANLLAVRGVSVGDRQPPRAVAAVFEGGHRFHLLLKR